MLPISSPLKKTSHSYKNKFAFDENIAQGEGKKFSSAGKSE